ncbi:hypothetical protein BT96DRAFT_1002321 [Gymnopus androsaceus JB14]|uniref:RING-type domain-containing protein n=1 Tax=Gymnopus androsaceus JB14 TaxID=1447944 RepID=A0A6A4GWY1_9AGAR|nr:hypothetical protein BT96DRAFT_1002321 [Gymnopus androsaceus JB14]
MPASCTVAASRAAAPYSHSNIHRYPAAPGSSDTEDEVKTTPVRRSRLTDKYEEIEAKAKRDQKRLYNLRARQTDLLTCPVCLDFAFQAQITECGHLYCAGCLATIRLRSVEEQAFTICGVCRGDLYLNPLPCRPLQDVIESIATANSLTIPDHVSNVWADRPVYVADPGMFTGTLSPTL